MCNLFRTVRLGNIHQHVAVNIMKETPWKGGNGGAWDVGAGQCSFSAMVPGVRGVFGHWQGASVDRAAWDQKTVGFDYLHVSKGQKRIAKTAEHYLS
jgi:hypothetical protein